MRIALFIDVLSAFFRAYHALPSLGYEGKQLGGVYGFTRMLIRAVRDFKPQVIVAFQDKGKSSRDKMDIRYKANRPKPLPEVRYQIGLIGRLLDSLDIPLIRREGYEADDLIVAYTEKAVESFPNLVLFILTGDKDLLSLTCYPKVKVILMRKGVTDFEVYDRKRFEREYGFPPDYYLYYKAIVGDPSDNVKGVRSLGKKRATKLIVSAINSSNDREPEIVLEELLRAHGQDAVEKFRHNIRLLRPSPIPVNEEDVKAVLNSEFKGLTSENFVNFLKEVNFKSILKGLGIEVTGVQGKLF